MLQECKTVALKRRKASSRLENLGIPEEELLRQQQELFAKVGEGRKKIKKSKLILTFLCEVKGRECDSIRTCSNILGLQHKSLSNMWCTF